MKRFHKIHLCNDFIKKFMQRFYKKNYAKCFLNDFMEGIYLMMDSFNDCIKRFLEMLKIQFAKR